MLTLGEFLAVISLTFTAFGFGYRLRRIQRKDTDETKTHKNSRPGLGKLGGYFL